MQVTETDLNSRSTPVETSASADREWKPPTPLHTGTEFIQPDEKQAQVRDLPKAKPTDQIAADGKLLRRPPVPASTDNETPGMYRPTDQLNADGRLQARPPANIMQQHLPPPSLSTTHTPPRQIFEGQTPSVSFQHFTKTSITSSLSDTYHQHSSQRPPSPQPRPTDQVTSDGKLLQHSSSSSASQRTSTLTQNLDVKHRIKQENDKFQLILDLNDPEELNSDYQALFNNVSIVFSLFLVILVPGEYLEVRPVEENMWRSWGSLDAEKRGVETFQLLTGLCVLLCIIGVLQCLTVSNQFAHVPSEHTRALMKAMGPLIVHGPSGPLLSGVAFLFLVSSGVRASLIFSPWVACTIAGCGLVACLFIIYLIAVIIGRKRAVLESIKAERDPSKMRHFHQKFE